MKYYKTISPGLRLRGDIPIIPLYTVSGTEMCNAPFSNV